MTWPIPFLNVIVLFLILLNMPQGQGRSKRPRALTRKIAARFCESIERHLVLSDKEAAKALGYASTSMLSSLRNGTTLPDPERLLRLAALRTPTNEQIDLHWLLTGEGHPVRRPEQPGALADLRKRAMTALETADRETLRLAMTLATRPRR
jgi:transcriptional regulator with XRE-family HTH domain